jgi:hypothetical protein
LKYLIDANVLSEITKPEPQIRVTDWLRGHERQIVVDPIVLGEIRFGIHLVSSVARRRRLEQWFDEVIQTIRCLPWQAKTGLRWAKLLAELRAAGKSMPIKDSLIAATALVHNLTIVTRNKRDFLNAGVKVIDPFAP